MSVVEVIIEVESVDSERQVIKMERQIEIGESVRFMEIDGIYAGIVVVKNGDFIQVEIKSAEVFGTCSPSYSGTISVPLMRVITA